MWRFSMAWIRSVHSNEELAQFKALLNDMYSRDISKIRGAFQVQKSRENICPVSHLMVIEKIRPTGTGF